MLTALILLIFVAGIVYAARRWPDVEARLFGVDKVDVPKEQTAEPTPVEHKEDRAKKSVKEHAERATEAAESTMHKVTEMAGGLFKKRSLKNEPKLSGQTEKKEDIFSSDPVQGDEISEDAVPGQEVKEEVLADEGEKSLAEEERAEAEPTPRRKHTPGERVTSTPARPSQPAYLDATRHQSDNFEHLSAEADQAWRDREYERCEEACLKILVQQPKNIKYMTRIGQVYQQLGQLDDAKEAFEAAKKLDPRNFFVLNRLSEVERLQSDKKGRTQLNKVLKK